eukprot:GEMP01122201.1.p2 GENE.GEMP01122201.1~~GEMP01122201.1.p2  ORF type:complete len:163 (-),score=33.43 GEMP01122201.1:37-525(-)
MPLRGNPPLLCGDSVWRMPQGAVSHSSSLCMEAASLAASLSAANCSSAPMRRLPVCSAAASSAQEEPARLSWCACCSLTATGRCTTNFASGRWDIYLPVRVANLMLWLLVAFSSQEKPTRFSWCVLCSLIATGRWTTHLAAGATRLAYRSSVARFGVDDIFL